MPALTERAPREVTPTTEETSEAPRSVESPISETELGNQAVSLAADLAPALGTVLDPLSAPLSNHVVARRLASANGPRRPSVLTLPKVSKPTDPFEREASAIARTVAAGEASTETVLRSADETAAEAEPVDELRPDASVALAAGGMAGSDGDPSEVDEETASLIAEPGAGMPIPSDVREQVEAAVDADLSGVTVHTDEAAAAAAARLSARAFTYGSDIYLGEGESPYDLELMAHESVHVVQQGAAEALGRMVDARYGDGGIQRDWLPDIPTSLADFAEYIPGFDLFCLLIGFNPFTGGSVPPTPENLIQGLMGIAPGGRFVYDGLAQVEAVQPAFAFVQAQVGSLGVTGERIETLIDRTWDQLDLTPRLGIISENVAIVERNFGALLDEVVTFATDLIDGILEFIKEAAVDVAEDLVDESPTWEVIKEVIHYDPLRDQPVDVPTVEILEHVLVLLGKQTEVEQMKERGTLQETADWLDTQFATFDSLLSELKQLVTDAWNAIQPENLPNILSNLESLAQRALGFFQRVVDFGITLALTVLRLIKDALLSWLSDVAHETPGFHLITVILGQNPFTKEEVPRTAENLIKGFITLLPDGEAVYADLSETGVIGTAAGNIEAAVEDLGISWELITGTFLGIWNELTLENLIEPVATFERIVDAFGEPIGRILEFIQVVFEEVIRLIAALTGFPGGLIDSIVTNAMAAYEDIKSDPAQFFSNMIEALETGFSNFFDGFLGHLLTGLVEWLMGTIEDAGLTPPADLSFESVLTFVLEVLDISVERMWSELAERIGQERVDQMRAALDRLVGIFAFVRDVVTEGPAAIWSYIEDQLSGLWDTILEMATEWIMETIITRVTAKLLSMLDPSGIMAAVNTCIAVYNAIESAIQYMTAILEVIDGWVSTLASVARGDVGPGAERVEGGMAASIPIAIGFLANQVGLDNLGEKIAEIVAGIRELVDQAIDWLMDQALAAVQSLAAMLGVGPEGEEGEETETGDVGEELEGLPQDDVRAQALGRIRAQLGAIMSIEALHSALDSTAAEFSSSGLTSLQAHVTSPASGTIAIEAAASPPARITFPVTELFGGPAASEELQTQLITQSTQATFAAISVDGRTIGGNSISSGPRGHAEENLIISSQWAAALEMAGPGSTITVGINRSPCVHCVQHLNQAIADAESALGPLADSVTFRLVSAGTYQKQATLSAADQEMLRERYQHLIGVWPFQELVTAIQQEIRMIKEDAQSESTEWIDPEDAELYSGLGALHGAGWQVGAFEEALDRARGRELVGRIKAIYDREAAQHAADVAHTST